MATEAKRGAWGRAAVLTILIPAYNEEGSIEKTVEALVSHFDGADIDGTKIDYEILVVNDGSTDGTEAVLRRLAETYPRLRHVMNRGPHGYGRAVRCGLEEFAGDAVVVTMADGSDTPADVAALYRCVAKGADCGFGSRFAPGATVEGYPRLKLAINRMGNHVLAWWLSEPYDDFTNGFKCYKRAVIEAMKPFVSAEFNLTVEMSIKALQQGVRYEVVPNHWRDREEGSSSFGIGRQVWLYFLTFLYCRLQFRLARGGLLRKAPVPGIDAPVGGGAAEG